MHDDSWTARVGQSSTARIPASTAASSPIRRRSRALLLATAALLFALTGCPQTTNNTGEPGNTDNSSNTGDNNSGDTGNSGNNSDSGNTGNNNDNSDGDDSVGPPNPNSGDGQPRVTVTLNGVTGDETEMHVIVFVGDRAVLRSETADMTALRAEGINDFEIQTYDTPGSKSSEITVHTGDVISVMPIESPGTHDGPYIGQLPDVDTSAVEFVNFTGTFDSEPEPGVATLAVDANTNAELNVNFRVMPRIIVRLLGVTAVHVAFNLPDVLELPARENSLNSADPTDWGSGLIVNVATPYLALQYKAGGDVTLTAAPGGAVNFVRWDGECAGNGISCMLTFGGDTGVEDFDTTAVVQYWECPIDAPIAHTNDEGGCSLVSP